MTIEEFVSKLWDLVVAVFDFLTSSSVANTATWVGAVASTLVYLNVRTIRADFLFAARLPQLLDALQSNASTLSRYLNDFENNTDAIQTELATCKANLESVAQKMHGSTKKRIRKTARSLISDIDICSNLRPNPQKEYVRGIYTSLNGIIQDLLNLREDQKWSTRDAG